MTLQTPETTLAPDTTAEVEEAGLHPETPINLAERAAEAYRESLQEPIDDQP